MAGYSPKLPIMRDADDGYALTKTLQELARQNFKMLVLTNPGERIMDPKFGVGIKSFLFENNSELTYGKIRSKIIEQVSTYLPYIIIENIDFSSINSNPDISENFISVRIQYSIRDLSTSDLLEISINP